MSDTFEATVRDLTAMGNGVVDHPNGQVFFVPGVWPGDHGVFAVKSVEKRYGFADLTDLMTPSPDRVSAPCAHQGLGPDRCGGCPWMMASYDAQLKAKEQATRHLLSRAQACDPDTRFLPIWGSPREFGYRNRAQFKTDGKSLGFVARGTRELVEIHDCLILNDKNRKTLMELRSQLPKSDWAPSEGYQWSYVEIDDSIDAHQVVPNRRLPFRQGNTDQNSKMQSWLEEKLQPLNRNDAVIELFAGSGNFTEILVRLGFERIVAAEYVGGAVKALEQRNWSGVSALACNLSLPSSWNRIRTLAKDAKVLLLDPPREGFKELADFLKGFRDLERIHYISCETGHFARDAAKLRKLGWRLEEVQPLDQFPHTPYVELLAQFGRAPK